MKKTLLTLITLIAVTTVSAQKYVGGDLSLVVLFLPTKRLVTNGWMLKAILSTPSIATV